uniref:Uncharacterized protein n=1 Tax=Echinococcus canadensis TaxID=519352 RepID=A0A915EYM5_9CEST
MGRCAGVGKWEREREVPLKLPVMLTTKTTSMTISAHLEDVALQVWKIRLLWMAESIAMFNGGDIKSIWTTVNNLTLGLQMITSNAVRKDSIEMTSRDKFACILRAPLKACLVLLYYTTCVINEDIVVDTGLK